MSGKWIVEFKLKIPIEVINCKGEPIVVFVDATCDWNKPNEEYIKVKYKSEI
jgi:hypothetical protein